MSDAEEWSPYPLAQALITCCLDSNPEGALVIFEDAMVGADVNVATMTARLAQLALALTEIATSVHLAWSNVCDLDRDEALEEWASMIEAANLARLQNGETV